MGLKLFVFIALYMFYFWHNVKTQEISCKRCYPHECGCGIFPCDREFPPIEHRYYEKGIPDGNKVDLPLIDTDYIYNLFPVCPCVYARLDDNCEIPFTSGLYIGGEINLANVTDKMKGMFQDKNKTIDLLDIKKQAMNDKIINYLYESKFRPYYHCKPKEINTRSPCEGSYDITALKEINDVYMDYYIKLMHHQYNECISKFPNGTKFENVPKGIRTTLFSSYYTRLDPMSFWSTWRHYALQNYEILVKKYIEDYNTVKSPVDKLNFIRRVSLMSYALQDKCPTMNTTFSIVLIVDSDKTDVVNKIIGEMIKFWSDNAYTDFDIYMSIVWQTDVAVHKFDPLRMDPALVRVYKVPNSTHSSIDSLLSTAEKLLEGEPLNTLDVLVYIGEEILDSKNMFLKILEVERKKVLLYAIETNAEHNETNLEMFARTSLIVYTANEVKQLCEGITSWSEYSCAQPTILQGARSYTFTLIPKTYYFAYTGVASSINSRNITVDMLFDNPGSVEIYYSNKFKNPGPKLRDGLVKNENGNTIDLSFSYIGAMDDTQVITYYFAVSSSASQTIKFFINEGMSPVMAPCTLGCIDCDLAGQGCKKCAPFYEPIRTGCRKAYVETIVPISNYRDKPMYPVYLIVFAIIIISGVLACFSANRAINQVKAGVN